MDTVDMLDRLQGVFREVFDRGDLVLSDPMTPDDIDGWDSLAQIRLVFAIQEAFGIEFELDVLPKLTSVGRIIREIQSRQ